MKKPIVIINGTGFSGKDMFVALCSKYANVYNFSSVDFVKEVATFAGWDGSKEEKDRLFLSELKRILGEWNDVPYKKTIEAINNFCDNPEQDIMFIHIREPKQIDRIVELGKIYSKLFIETLLITRDNAPIIETNESDKNVLEYDYNLTIYNNSTTQELDCVAEKYVDMLLRYGGKDEQV